MIPLNINLQPHPCENPKAVVLGVHFQGGRNIRDNPDNIRETCDLKHQETYHYKESHADPDLCASAVPSAVAAVARDIAAHGRKGLNGPDGYDHISHVRTPPSSPLEQRPPASLWLRNTPSSSPMALSTHQRASPRELDDIDHLAGERVRTAGLFRLSSTPNAVHMKSQAWAHGPGEEKNVLRRGQVAANKKVCIFSQVLGSSKGACTAHAGATQLEKSQRRHPQDVELRRSGSNPHRWTGQATVPREFHLGMRVAEPIPSLRRPCMPQTTSCGDGGFAATSVGRDAGGGALTGELPIRGAVQTQRCTSSTRQSPDGKTRGRDTIATSPAVSDAAGSPVRSSAQETSTRQLPMSFTPPTPAARRCNLSAVKSQLALLNVNKQGLLCRLREQLAHKDTVIQRQAEELERLHQELDIVKDTLRQIVTLGASP